MAIAREYGVPIAAGSDYIERTQHGSNLEEIAHLHRAGLKSRRPFLRRRHAVQNRGVADRFGRIAPGYVFDAVLLDDDPSDVTLFKRPDAVSGVFKAGEAVVQHPQTERAIAGVADAKG